MENHSEMDYLFEEKKTSTTTKSLTAEERKKKEFRISKDSNEEEVFRVIKPKNSKKHYHEAHFHEARVHGFSKTLNCPYSDVISTYGNPDTNSYYYENFLDKAESLDDCPFCKKAKEFKIEQAKYSKDKEDEKVKRDEWFKRYNKLKPRLYYIFEGIDRNRIGDGVKFWRSKHNFKGEGVWDLLRTLVKRSFTKTNTIFTDPHKGFDLEILTADATYNGIAFKKVQTITLSESKPLNEKEEKINEILNHNMSWVSVFPPTTAPNHNQKQYMEAVLEGRAPKWNKTEKAWYVNDTKLEYDRNGIDNITDEDALDYGDPETDMGQAVTNMAKSLEKEIILEEPKAVVAEQPKVETPKVVVAEKPKADFTDTLKESPAVVAEENEFDDLPF